LESCFLYRLKNPCGPVTALNPGLTLVIAMASATTSNPPAPRLEAASKELISSLTAHPNFVTEQSARRGSVYFVWDFVCKTQRMLETWDGKFGAVSRDIMGRSLLANVLVNDTSGKRALICGEDPSNPVDFGADVKRKSQAVQNATQELCK
jgi:hypothetical protein